MVVAVVAVAVAVAIHRPCRHIPEPRPQVPCHRTLLERLAVLGGHPRRPLVWEVQV